MQKVKAWQWVAFSALVLLVVAGIVVAVNTLPVYSEKDLNVQEVSGMVVWEKYVTDDQPDGGAGWVLVTEKVRYILHDPPKEIASKCGMCKFKAKMQVRPLQTLAAVGRGYGRVEVVKVLDLQEELCDH